MTGWRFVREIRTMRGLRWIWRKYSDHLTITCETGVGETP